MPVCLPEPSAAAVTPKGWRNWVRRPWWPWAQKTLATLFFIVVAFLLLRLAQTVSWAEVGQAMRALPVERICTAAALALASHGVYGTFDWVGRHCSAHGLGRAATLRVAMTSYPFTLNLGTLIGGLGVRYRLYSRRGLELSTIGQVVALSIVTNWVGYLLLASVLPWIWVPPSIGSWSGTQWKIAGAGLGILPLSYVVLCYVRPGCSISIRGRAFALPGGKVALWQIAVSACNWMLMGAVVWILLQGQASYAASLATVMLGAVAGLVLRVPAGLGVLETVAVTLLAGPNLTAGQVLAAILAYRALYYFGPLVPAALSLAMDERVGAGRA